MTNTSTRDKLSSVILWSVISAAFIGPGTVTTAVTAGSHYQLNLLWSIVFATIACVILQEISARIAIASGLTFGQAIERKFGTQKGFWVKWFIGGSVVLGCAAYEAGNILGAVSGFDLIFKGDLKIYTIIISLVSAAILWSGKTKWISILMTILVGMMGIAFIVLALNTQFSFFDLLESSVVPRIPVGAEMITLGLVGTTIVPYNLFLSSGISKGQTVPLMRIGLVISVLIGGIITAAILIAGTVVNDFSSFPGLAAEFKSQMGMIGVLSLGVGLFAAGFSSAITSPYAASVIATTVFNAQKKSTVRWVWGLVLLTGFAFGFSGIKPIPVILAVQALNGLILPLVTAYLILLINDKDLIPQQFRHSKIYDLILLLILGSVLMMGLNNVDKSFSTAFNTTSPSHLSVVITLTVAVVVYVAYLLQKQYRIKN